MAKNIVGWFGVREKYCSLTDKSWLISQIRPSEQADSQQINLLPQLACVWSESDQAMSGRTEGSRAPPVARDGSRYNTVLFLCLGR